MHFDGFALSGDVHGGEGEDHAWFKETSLNSTDGDSSNTTDLVDILKWESEGLILGSLGGFKDIKGFEKAWTIVPFHVI